MKKEKQVKEPKEQQPSFFQELGGFMKPYQGLYTGSVLVSILGVCANLASYAFMGLIAAAVFDRSRAEHVLLLALAAALCKLLHALLCNFSTWCSHKAAYRTLRDVRQAMMDKLLRLPMGYFEVNGSGRLKALITDQVENMETPLAHVLPEMTGNLLGPLALLIWLFVLDWRLGLCTLIWIMLGFSVTGGMMKGYEEKFAGQLAASKGMNQAVTEYVGGIEVIKNFGQDDACCSKYENAVYGHAAYNVGWQKETQTYSALGMAIAPFSVFPVLIAGLLFYGSGSLTGADLFLAVLLTMGIFQPLMSAMNYFDQLAQMGTVAKEMKDILEYPELKRGEGAQPESAEIRFDHVTFSYDEHSAPAVKDVSFTVPAGTMLALVGPSGSGKSTIARLLAGYWDADKGEITIGGQPMSAFTQAQLNALIANVDQDTFLFDRSIADNIRIGYPEASDDQVQEAARAAGCDDFIRALPQGYDTPAGLAGSKLSGGQKQRIAIARAMMKQAPILILDEATASADPENEALIQTAISAAAKGKTLIVVAHHLSTIVNAQQIAYVDGGEIRQIGTHQELLERCPAYAELWALSKEG